MNMPTPHIRPDILLQSGNYFDFLVPHTCDVCIEDIAHALSNICRFGGHTHKFYSVAQHSVLVSHELEQHGLGMEGLLHDGAEAFDYKVIEQRVEQAIFPIFGIAYPLPSIVKHADLVLLATEQRDLMPEHDDQWALIADIKPLEETIEPWTPEHAFRAFMMRYEELGGVMG